MSIWLTCTVHLTALQANLEWLDLSFNNISKLEGLEKLTKLTDLSLFSNKLEKVENIQGLAELVVLSLGRLFAHVLTSQACWTRLLSVRCVLLHASI